VADLLRLARFREGDRSFYALLGDDGRARPMSVDPFDTDPFAVLARTKGPALPVDAWEWLPPCRPSKIVGVGRNYRDHAAELGNAVPEVPLLFLKPPSALLPPGGVIRLPPDSRRVDFEGELGVVIGRTARNVAESRARDFILGYACVNDVTARDLQKRDGQFTRAKGFDSFCPFGPAIAVGLQPDALRIETFVNGERRQSAPASSMIFGIDALVSFVSHIMTLLPGDLIATGTPEGVGPLEPGDEVTVSIEGIGRLTNRVEAAPTQTEG
jgi:2-keto-4-pentenoate hydratase/2-oxohepta-3-ene-1,7-dioic acid hydratase in catechol pathway